MADFRLEKLDENFLPGALEVLRHGFFPDEMACIGVGILTESPVVPHPSKFECTAGSLELEALCTDVVKDGVSLCAVDSNTEEVIGVAFNKLQVLNKDGEEPYFINFAKTMSDPAALALMDIMIKADEQKDLFQHFNSSCGLEIMFLGVRPTARCRGIAVALIKESISRARKLSAPKPTFACALFSSRFSQGAGKKAGMTHLLEIPYSIFKYKGVTLDTRVPKEHPFITLSAIEF